VKLGGKGAAWQGRQSERAELRTALRAEWRTAWNRHGPGARWRDLRSQPLTANRFHLSRVGTFPA
jgi:hypothetical protein